MVVTFTIVTRDHLHRARVLMDSVREHIPEALRYVVLADNPGTAFDVKGEIFSVISPRELAFPRHRALAFALDPASFCYALKAFSAQHLRRAHPDAVVIYFDSDTALYARPTELIDATSSHPVVLTPHLLEPMRNAPAKCETMRSGAYNGGLFAVAASPRAGEFLDWWHAQLCIPDNVHADWNHDQGWLNLVPGFFPDAKILRHPGYNVAFWNLHERPLTEGLGGELRAAGERLVLFHFSYFDTRRPDLLVARFGISPPNDIVRALLARYAQQLKEAGESECTGWGTELRTFQDGRPITSQHREYFRQRFWNHIPADADPFDPTFTSGGLTGLKSLYRADHWLTRALRRLRR